MVNKALEALGSKKEDAVYIGDSDVDIKTAANAELPCISVLWGFRDKKFLQENGAKLLVEQPNEVLDVLK
jgi:phosphoglycolate phosphatase